MDRRARGFDAEKKACDFLTTQGLELVEQNYLTKHGEIDLIMQDKPDLVFVEVRYRAREDYGGSVASISREKQRRIINTATRYLLANKNYDKIPCRFDVVAMSDKLDAPINWIQNAFMVKW